MLRLVHPAREGQSTRPPKGSRATVTLTAEETRHARVALRNLSRAYGSWGCLAAAMEVPVHSLKNAMRRPIGPGLAMRTARAAGMSVEAILTGQINAAGRCTACGSRVGDGAARRAS